MILQGPTHSDQVLGALAALISEPGVERLRIAVAYASLPGVRALSGLLAAAENDIATEVVVTLDMGITRKAALEALLGCDAATKAIVTPPGPGTFHAKAFVVDRGDATKRAMVGSANLTYPALTTNYEAVRTMDLSEEEGEGWEAWWGDLVSAAVDLTPAVIEQYQERRPPPGRCESIADEEEETNMDGSPVSRDRPESLASEAAWLVIDWGGTGEYRVQYEFPQDPAGFFAPVAVERRQITVDHAGAEYLANYLRFYADNGMARINLDPEIPVVADESIKQQATLFTRLDPDRYELRLVDRDERAAFLAESAAVGGVGHTTRTDGTKRRFGWGGSR